MSRNSCNKTYQVLKETTRRPELQVRSFRAEHRPFHPSGSPSSDSLPCSWSRTPVANILSFSFCRGRDSAFCPKAQVARKEGQHVHQSKVKGVPWSELVRPRSVTSLLAAQRWSPRCREHRSSQRKFQGLPRGGKTEALV